MMSWFAAKVWANSCWGAIVQAAVWPLLVIFNSPGCDLSSCFPEVKQPVRIQAFIAQSPIKTFGESILDRLAWLDVRELNPAVDSPRKKVSGGELCAVVQSNALWPATLKNDAVECPRDAPAR